MAASPGMDPPQKKHITLKLIAAQGYLPLPTSLRSSTLARKRSEYQNMVDLAFARGREGLDQQIWHQIEIDVPRTRPGVKLWMHAETQRVGFCKRILHIGSS